MYSRSGFGIGIGICFCNELFISTQYGLCALFVASIFQWNFTNHLMISLISIIFFSRHETSSADWSYSSSSTHVWASANIKYKYIIILGRTWNTGSQCNEHYRSDTIFDAQSTAKMWRNITNDSGHHSNCNNWHNKANITTINICKIGNNRNEKV